MGRGERLEDFTNIKYNNTEAWRYMEIDYLRQIALINHPEMGLPVVSQAIAPKEKFTNYLFNPENKRGWAKGQAMISRLGYSADNWELLQEEILHGAKLYPVDYMGNNGYGDKYEQRMILYGATGNPANVVVGWIVKEDGNISMTSAYIKEVK